MPGMIPIEKLPWDKIITLAPYIFDGAQKIANSLLETKSGKNTTEERLSNLERATIEQSQLFERVARIDEAYAQVIGSMSRKIRWLIVSNVVLFGLLIVTLGFVMKF